MAPPSRLSVATGGERDEAPVPTAPVKWAPSGASKSKQPTSSSSASTSSAMQASKLTAAKAVKATEAPPTAPLSTPAAHELLSIMVKKATTKIGAGGVGGMVSSSAAAAGDTQTETSQPVTVDRGPLLTPQQHAKLQGLSECLTALESLSRESERLLNQLDTTLSPLISSTAPLLAQSSLLLKAGRNIESTKGSLQELLSYLETSHKVESSLRSGPRGYRGDLDAYLGHLASLDQAIKFLEAHSQLASAQDAYSHSLQVHSRAMKDCDVDFSQTLTQQTSMTMPSPALLSSQSNDENFSTSMQDPPLEPIVGPPLTRLQKLAQVTTRSGHDGCIKAYVDIRRRQAVEGSLRLLGYDPSLSLSSLELQGIDQIDKTVASWSEHLRVACLIAASELRLARLLWGPLSSPSSSLVNHESIFYSVVGPTFHTLLKQGQDLSVMRGGRGFGALIGAISKGKPVAAARAVQSLPTDMIGDVLDLAGIGGGGGGGGRDQRIFTLLEMSKQLAFILPSLQELLAPISKGKKLVSATSALLDDLSAQAKQSYHDFEQGLIRDQSKAQTVDGTVHPICAHVLSYLRRLFSYSNARKVVFDESSSSPPDEDDEDEDEDIDFVSEEEGEEGEEDGGNIRPGTKKKRMTKDPSKPSAFETQSPRSSSIGLSVSRVMDSLIQALEGKSRQYKNPALGALFMMNNLQYICSTVASSTTSNHLYLNDRWLERHKDKVEAYGQSYHETTWLPIIQPIVMVISGVSRGATHH